MMETITEECSVCGAECAGATFPPSHNLPLLARDGEGIPYCQKCAADSDRMLIDNGEPLGAYLSSDGKYLTTWAGEVLATITSEGSYSGGFYGSSITCWRAVTPDGIKLYGRNGGRGMSTGIRYAR